MLARTCSIRSAAVAATAAQSPGAVLVFSNVCTRRHMSATTTSDEGNQEKQSFFQKYVAGGKRRTNEDKMESEKELEDLYQSEQEALLAMEAEEKAASLKRSRNKSRLHHSDRQMLRGLAPEVGLTMQWCERHTTREFKARMLGQFGRQNTGVNPSVAWPSKAEMGRQADYERLVYEGKTLQERIAISQAQEKAEREEIFAKERDIDDKLATMDKELKVWKGRIEKREAEAAKEKALKDQIFAELREEFGYNVDPNDPQFADKIAEKEKALAKRQKEEKKKLRGDKKAAAVEKPVPATAS